MQKLNSGHSFHGRVFRPFAWTACVAIGLAACGGGSSGDSSTPLPPSGVAVASLATPSSGKSPWSLSTPIAVTLKDGSGNLVSTALNCSSADPVALTVAADCSSVTGRRLGAQTITVSAGAVSANTSIKVIPQPQPIGTQGSVSNGGYSLVVTPAGKVMAWGANAEGALGQGKFSTELPSLSLPIAVKDQSGQGELSGIVAVSAGEGTALALTEEGEVWSWGGNGHSELGRGVFTGDALPGKVRNAAGTGSLNHIVAISMGAENAVALADDGTVYSWGYDFGTVPPGTKNFPSQVKSVTGADALSGVAAISSGSSWSAALTAEGKVVTWGFNYSLSTGQGVTASPVPPGYVLRESDGAAIDNIVAISAGYGFGMALTSSGQVYAWGTNLSGQSGQNTGPANSPTPKALLVKGLGGVGQLGNIKMVAAGGLHALALGVDGTVYSWGASATGALGDGPNHPRVSLNQTSLPGAVVSEAGTGQLGGIAIAAGYDYSLALANDGGLLIWGSGFRSNLGQGGTSTANSYVPLRVKDTAGSGTLSLGPVSYWPNLTRRGR